MANNLVQSAKKTSRRCLDILQQPYPFQFLFTHTFWATLGLSTFLFLFLKVFEPFGLGQNLRTSVYAAAAVYSLIPSLVIIVHRHALRAFLPFYSKESEWTIGKEVTFYLILFVSVGILNTVASFFLDANVSVEVILEEFLRDTLHTVAIGVIPVVLLNLLSYIFLLRKNQQKSTQLSDVLRERVPETATRPESTIRITSPLKKDELVINLEEVLFVQSVGNYLDIYFENGKKTVRHSMSSFESLLSGHPEFFRCHRSYIINVRKIKQVTGNSMGYKVFFGDDLEVPVSRAKLEEFDKAVRNQI
jgi:DNA-binding LytR/AlgR family response regulator